LVAPIHVLFLNWRDTRNPEGGGSELYVERVAAELVAAGYRATVFCAAHTEAPSDEMTAAGVRILRRGTRFSVYPRAALACLGGVLGRGPFARPSRPDVVVDVCNGLPFLSPLYSDRPVIALVHHVHREQWPVVLPGMKGRLGWWIESRLAPRVYRRCRYVAVSEATRAELTELGVAPDRITVIHNGTPEPPAVPAAERSTQPTLVVLGRLVPHKQIEIALRTVAALAADRPDVQLIVAGQGWWEPRLREFAAEIGVVDRVRFTGHVSDEEKHALLASAWVALNPSLKEGWGLTIVEAGSHGTPTVAFRSAGGVREALVDGETGLLADDPDDFVAKVGELLADESRRLAMGEAAAKHAQEYTWAAAGRHFAELTTAVLRAPYLVP
jgi:glycosyltransferase involved in cell wall biosynthesis